MTSNGSQAALSDDRLQELAKRHLMMHFTRHSTFRNEDVPIITRGEGCYLYDSKGKRYFDGLAGLFCTQIGYSFGAELGEAAATQMAELPFYTNWSYAHPRVDRAGRQGGRAGARRPQPRLLRVRRLGGQRGHHQARAPVPPAAGATTAATR